MGGNGKYANFLTILLIIIIIAIIGLIGYFSYDVYKKYVTEQEASEFVNNFGQEIKPTQVPTKAPEPTEASPNPQIPFKLYL